MTQMHVFDPHLDAARLWLTELMDNLELSPSEDRRALHALRAGLHAIRDRLPANEVLDLAAQLPMVIRGVFFEGWRLPTHEQAIRDRREMIDRVAHELRPDPQLDPADVLRAVIHLLVEHVSDGEIRDVIATLPKSIAELWQDLTGHALAERSAWQRTGYSR